MDLYHGPTAVHSVFDLMGTRETDMTAALGFVFSRSDAFTQAVLTKAFRSPMALTPGSVVRLETSKIGEGRTDIELDIKDTALIVFEAKQGVNLPTAEQLSLYAPRLRAAAANNRLVRLVTLTHALPENAGVHLRHLALPDITVLHWSWAQLRTLAEHVGRQARGKEQTVLKEFVQYLNRIVQMDVIYSNMVYVVALAEGNPSGWQISWQDIVIKRQKYFYPAGLTPPPNYIAFRYNGRLQSIHHVEGHEVLTQATAVFPEGDDLLFGGTPHYCLSLGPAIVPPRIVKAGPRVNRGARVWCMLDTLLTFDTLSDALTETQRRTKRLDGSASIEPIAVPA